MWTRPLSPGLLHTASGQLLVGEPGDECAQGLPVTRRFVTAALASAQRLSGPSQPSRGVASLCVAVAFAVDHPRGQRVCPGDDASGPGTTVALSAAELAPRRRQKLRGPLEGRNAGGVWEAGRGPAHAPGRVGTRRHHPNGLAFAGSWGRLLPSRLEGRRPSGGALGSRSAHAGSSDASERRSAAEAAAAQGRSGVLAPRRSSQVPPDAPPGARASPLGVRAQSPGPPLPPPRLSVTARPLDDCWV